jgi:protein-disulfide isomerase
MSNRQARREQSRTARTTARTKRPTKPAPGQPPKKSGGGPDLFSAPYLIGLSILIVAMAVLLIVVAGRGGDGESDMAANLREAHENLPQDMASGASLGNADAPVKLDMYEDFQCIFCLRHTADAEPTIVEEYVKTGKVQITFKHFPALGTESVRAALASQCAADQERFWDYHNQLFLYQAERGLTVNQGRYSDDNLRRFANDLGLDMTEFNACFDSDKHLSLITEQQRTGRAYGITGTPSFVINGQPLGSGGFDVEGWRRVLDEAYTSATASPTPGN